MQAPPYCPSLCILTVPPNAPKDLTLESFGDSWITLSWFQIPSEIEIIQQIVLVRGGGIEWNITLQGDENTVNVTDLLHGNEYIFRIIAMAIDRQLSLPSDPLITNTAFKSELYTNLY